jgi:deoxycytidylate deaminase
MKGKCTKQETIAIIENNGQYWIGSNWCNNAQEECPRTGMETGIGYELCKSICEQQNHAEVDACIKAGENAKGGTLYLLGHTYCCDNCKMIMDQYGIKNVIIGKIPTNILSKEVID